MRPSSRFVHLCHKRWQVVPASLLLLTLAACGGGSSPAPTPPTPPTVNAAPQSQSASVGNPVQFSVQATGSAPLSYQWQRDGVDIPGATAASYSLSAASLADSNAHYRVLLKNAAGSATSAEATLKVTGIELFAGSLTEPGNLDGSARDARFSGAAGLAFDTAGNLFVADMNNQALRKIAKDGVVSTVAGPAQGLRVPIGVMLDSTGNAMVSDVNIMKVTPAGVVTQAVVIPVGSGDSRSGAMFLPTGVAIDPAGNIYAANGVGTRKVTPTGTLSILEGVNVVDGAFGTRGISYRGITRDSLGNVYFGSADGILKAGVDGSIKPYLPNRAGRWLVMDASGNFYRNEGVSEIITKIDTSGKESTVVGVAGDTVTTLGALPGRLSFTQGLAIDSKGFLYVSNMGTAVLKIGLP